MSTTTLAEEFRGPIVVTCLYIVLHYIFMFQQMGSKSAAAQQMNVDKRSFNRFDHSNLRWKFGDRVYNNNLENEVLFLSSMWMHAYFVDPDVAGVFGGIAVFLRLLYPVFWSLKARWNLLIEISTQGWAICVFYFVGATFFQAFGVDVYHKTSTGAQIGIAIGC